MLSSALNKKTFFQKLLTKKSLWAFVVVLCLFVPVAAFAVGGADGLGLDLNNVEDSDPSEGGGWLGAFGGAILWVVSHLLYVVFKIFGFFLSIALKLLGLIVSAELFEVMFSSPESLAALNTGWGAVRDFFNMFFILIFLFIAISIILGISKYNDKSNIVKVIIAAILINFSKAITLLVIDISQLAMNFFASALQVSNRSFEGLLAEKMGMKHLFSLDFGEGSAFLISLVFAIVFVFIMTGMIFTLAFALVIRLIAFWVLIILSPIAMFGIALPGSVGGNLTGTWFKKLMSWAFFGPVMMFFLWLALVVVSAISGAMDSSDLADGMAPQVQGGDHGYLAAISGIMLPFMAGIYLLYFGFDLSQKLSEGFATTVLSKGRDWTGRALKGSLKGPGKLAASGLTGGLASRAGMEGVADSYENSALGRNRLTRLATKKGREKSADNARTRFSSEKGKQAAERTKVNEEMKRFKDNLTDDEVGEVLSNKKASRQSRAAAAMHLNEKGKLNDAKKYGEALSAVDDNEYLNNTAKKNFKTMAQKKNLAGFSQFEKERLKKEYKEKNPNSSNEAIEGLVSAELKGNLRKVFQGMNVEDIKKQSKETFQDKEIMSQLLDYDEKENNGRFKKSLGNKMRLAKDLPAESASLVRRRIREHDNNNKNKSKTPDVTDERIQQQRIKNQERMNRELSDVEEVREDRVAERQRTNQEEIEKAMGDERMK